MAVERMSCCGAITRTYAYAGSRQHKPNCPVALAKEYNAAVANGNIIRARHLDRIIKHLESK